MAQVQVGFLIVNAETTADLADALVSIATLLRAEGLEPIGNDYKVKHMTVQIRQR